MPEKRTAMLSADGRYICACGASHKRGPVNGVDVYRCLKCGETHRFKKTSKKQGFILPVVFLLSVLIILGGIAVSLIVQCREASRLIKEHRLRKVVEASWDTTSQQN